MNAARRKALNALYKRIEESKAAVEKLFEGLDTSTHDELEEVKADVEAIRDEEQESFDNMPESLQGGDTGQAKEEAVSNMDIAMTELETARDALEEVFAKFGDAQAALDLAMEALDNAQGAGQ